MKTNHKQRANTKRMEKQLKAIYGEYNYGIAIAFLLDTTINHLREKKEERLTKFSMSINDGDTFVYDFTKGTFNKVAPKKEAKPKCKK